MIDPDNEEDILEGLEALYDRLDEFDDTDVGDIDVMLNVNARDLEDSEIPEVRKKLIEEGYIELEEEGGPEDKNSKLEKVRIEKFKQEIGYQESHDPREYFTESIHGNEKFDAEKMAEEIMRSHNFLKIQGQENGLKIYREGIWKDYQHAKETIEKEVNERLGQETSSRYRSNVRSIIKTHENVLIAEEDFKHSEKLLPFSNGVFNLEKNQLEEYRPDHHFTFKYEAEYRPDLDNKDVEKFIEDIAPEGEGKRKKLHEIAALTIAPWRIKELMPILFGKGSNGKNQYINVLKKILGRENYHITSSKRLSNDKFESASIHQAQLLFLDEFEDASSPGNLKRLTDSEQNVREMHKSPGTIETSVQPIFAANELPNPEEDSEGFYRRWQIIDFNQKFTDQEDNNPDKLSPKELEEKYMSKEAIDSYATSLVSHLKDVLDSNKLTDQQTQSKVRAIWEEKASAVYRFIDDYITQGKINYHKDNQVGDYIVKSDLAVLINSYLDEKNLSKTDKSHITRALEKHPDLEVNTSARPSPGDGLEPQQPTAYEGIRIREDRLHDIRGVLPLHAWRSPQLLRLTNYRNYVDIVQNEKTAIALEFLKQHGEEGVNMVELIKELNLEYEELEAINQSEYIEKENVEKNGTFIPYYIIDEEKLEEDVEDIDLMVDKDGKTIRPFEWLQDQVDSWSNQTIKQKENVVQKAKSAGFSEESIIEAMKQLENDGIVYEPKPGQVSKL